MSKCSGIVDGFNPKSVNPGLETKIDQELSKAQIAEREEDAFLKDIGIAGGVNAKKEWQYNRKKELPNNEDRFKQKEELIPHAQEFYHTVAATKTGAGASTKIDNEVYEQARTKYRSYVDKLLPIREIGRILNVPTFEEIAMGVDSKVRKGLFVNDRKEKKNKHFTYVPNGAIVESRLDITAYQKYDIWAVTLTSKTGKAFNGSKYGRAARLTNVTFPITDSQKLGAIKIAVTGPYGGVPKNPYAVMKGGFVNTPVKDMEAMMEEAFNSPDWVEIGVNPYRDPEFYRKDTGERIKGADEIIQIGPVVMAKNVRGSDTPRNFKPKKKDEIEQGTFLVYDEGDEMRMLAISKEDADGNRDLIGEINLDRDVWNDGTKEYVVQSVELKHKKYLNKGLGVKLYIKALEALLKSGKADYFTSGGMTTESAMRVWRSLFKNIDKHLENYPEIRQSIMLTPSNERGMIKHPGGGKEEPSYERDIGSEPAYSIELYAETYKELTKYRP